MTQKVQIELDRTEILTMWVAVSNYIFRMKQFINDVETSYTAELGQYEHIKQVLSDAYDQTKPTEIP